MPSLLVTRPMARLIRLCISPSWLLSRMPPAAVTTDFGRRVISAGRKGFEVLFLPVLLQVLGYDPASPSGFYSAQTMSAINAFQAA